MGILYKTNKESTVVFYKSRLVIRGEHAIERLEFFNTYAPVAKLETIRLTLALTILLKFKTSPIKYRQRLHTNGA